MGGLLRTLSNIYDGVFFKLMAIDYFCKKNSIIDLSLGLEKPPRLVTLK